MGPGARRGSRLLRHAVCPRNLLQMFVVESALTAPAVRLSFRTTQCTEFSRYSGEVKMSESCPFGPLEQKQRFVSLL